MRILFIENRYSTLLWREAAAGLANDGHEIHWLVQNHLFRPRCQYVHMLRYPEKIKQSLSILLNESHSRIARTDRALRYFGIDASHYPYYQTQIDDVLDNVRPQIVIGESTQFYELMVITGCKARNIPFLAPNSTRYPAGRLVFFREDTFNSVGGSGQQLSDDNASLILEQINSRTTQPSYMAPPHRSARAIVMRSWEQFRIAYGWFRGERFVTPAPWKRFAIGHAQSKAMQAWECLASDRQSVRTCSSLKVQDSWVLYPLQLQPESNIDVFGQPWNDQSEIVGRAASALSAIGAQLVIKPNPKSKYEMNAELINIVLKHPNIVPLPHDFSMRDIFPFAPLVLSVTGTVILECVFAGKPIAVLGDHALSRIKGVTAVTQPEEVATILPLALVGTATKASRADALTLIKELHSSSYEALLWDPISRPDLFEPVRLDQLRNAFRHMVENLDNCLVENI